MAEQLPVPDQSVALVAAAQAVHWFDFERFYAECRRVLQPGGVIAVWTYEKFRANARVDAALDRFYYDVIGPYWPPERRYVDEAYTTLPFPWAEEQAPAFTLVTDWSLEQVMGYLATWSSVQRYRDAHPGDDPLPALAAELATALACGRHGSSQLARPPAAGPQLSLYNRGPPGPSRGRVPVTESDSCRSAGPCPLPCASPLFTASAAPPRRRNRALRARA